MQTGYGRVRGREREKRDSSRATPQSVKKKSHQRQSLFTRPCGARVQCQPCIPSPLQSYVFLLFLGDVRLVLCPPRFHLLWLDLIFYLFGIFFGKKCKCGATRCAGKTIEEARTGAKNAVRVYICAGWGWNHVARWRCFALLSSLMHGPRLGWAVGIKTACSVRAEPVAGLVVPVGADAWRGFLGAGTGKRKEPPKARVGAIGFPRYNNTRTEDNIRT